jgi:hypothetical protein
VAGRDETKLVDSVIEQAERVTTAATNAQPGVPVHGCLCFVDSQLPLFGTPSLKSIAVLRRRGLVKRLNKPGDLDPTAIVSLAEALAAAFPPAT